MQCQRFSHIGENGEKVMRPKKVYYTMDEAVAVAKVYNLSPDHINKVVPYKCTECFKYHLGRNGKPLTEKYLDKVKKEVVYTVVIKKSLGFMGIRDSIGTLMNDKWYNDNLNYNYSGLWHLHERGKLFDILNKSSFKWKELKID